uniref:Uncharacterized protein n=1 Tax=Compsopogon caeruleus TaxID=31354 RepID=A0A7S1TDC1_9RHOD|mmetsp:Transcript_18503/g.38766  ORF Transcript_18503/g.38766 Transcript_18503/m.38766 type:complete len:336 (+) Transcript_18503:117-1124(+)
MKVGFIGLCPVLYCVDGRSGRCVKGVRYQVSRAWMGVGRRGVGDGEGSSSSSSSSESESDGVRSDDGSRDIEFELEERLEEPVEPSNELYEMIQSTPPSDLIVRFTQGAPTEVQQAFKVTLRNMLGSLPPLLYRMSVRTVTSNLVQLMQSCLMNGYMLRNVQYRLSISKSLLTSDEGSQWMSLPAPEPRIEGDARAIVVDANGTETSIPIQEYVAELRERVNSLDRELKSSKENTNEIVKLVSTMGPENLKELTSNAGSEVVDAMQRIIVAVTKNQQLPPSSDVIVETPTLELGQLLFWLMVCGYFLREAEVRFDMRKALNFTAQREENSEKENE